MDSQPAKVLIVDDDLDALDLLARVIRRAGYEPVCASSGLEAVSLAERHWRELDAAILDLMMPGELDGYGVCACLGNNPRTRNLPIVILSAKSSPSDMVRSVTSGALQHIAKPYDIQYLIAVVTNMVRMSRLERQALANAEKYRAIVDHAPLEMLVVSPEFKLLEMNDSFRRRRPHVRVGDDLREALPGQDLSARSSHPVVRTLLGRTGEQGLVEEEDDERGRIYWEIHSAPLRDEEGKLTAAVYIAVDVTGHQREQHKLMRKVEAHRRILQETDNLAQEQMDLRRQLSQKNQELEEAKLKLEQNNRELEEAKSELERLSQTDALTGLHNRRHFDELFPREIRRARRYHHWLAVLMLDLDHFKDVNDTHGHSAGDAVLSEIAHCIGEQLRETDTVARYGGEEFVVVLPETDREIATVIAGRLREAIARRRTKLENGTELAVTASIGVAALQSEITKDILRLADEALYQAKRAGRNQVVTADA